MKSKIITKNYMRHFNSLTDEQLLELIAELAYSKVRDRYKVIIRGKAKILLSDSWDRIEISEEGIYMYGDSDPSPYANQFLKKFDKFFCIRTGGN